MIEGLQNYLMSLILAGFLMTLVQLFLPNGSVKQIATATCGILLVLILIKPIARLDLEDLAASVSRIDLLEIETQGGITIDNQTIISDIIKENCEAYIWDKAEEYGVALRDVKVTITGDGDYPHPVHVVICGQFDATDKHLVSRWIASELAVDVENQEWIWN